MTIQFPADKFVNDTYDYNGLTYVWDGEKWTASGAAAFEDAYVNVTGDTMTGDLTVPSLNDGPLAGFRNQIINGDFRVWQRGINFSLPDNGRNNIYTADRFLVASNGTATIGRSTDTPAGFAFAISISSDHNGVYHAIELPLDSSGNVQAGVFSVGSVWTYSVWSTVDLTSKRVLLRWASSVGLGDASAVEPSTNFVAVPGSTSNGYTRYTSTVTIGSAPTNPQKCVAVYISGAGAAVRYTGIQLEPGPVATPFEHRPVGTELALCQRYYQVISARFNQSTLNTAANNGQKYHWQQVNYITPMRTVNPTKVLVDNKYYGMDYSDITPAALILHNVDNQSFAAQSSLQEGSYRATFTADAEL